MVLVHYFLTLCVLAEVYAVSSRSSAPSTKYIVSDSVLDLAMKINKDQSGNSVFSPLGISTALNLLLLGSEGNTRNELKTFFGYPEEASDSQIQVAFAGMIAGVNNKTSSAEINIANGLITQKGLGMEKSYTSDAMKYYGATTGTLDFKSEPIESMNKINEWVSNRTSGKISSLLSEPLPRETEMILLNAIYFKGAWETPFPVEQTRKLDFFAQPDAPVQANFMTNVLTVPYAESKELNCKAIVLPYMDKKFGMLFLLPNADGLNALRTLESKMDRVALDKLMKEDMEFRSAVVQIPKFKIRQTMNLRSVMSKNGASSVFGSSANFSKIAKNNTVKVDDVLHQAYIEVSEEGTEAAAATGVTITREAPAKSFIASKPFAFVIRHNTLDLSLFHGRVVLP